MFTLEPADGAPLIYEAGQYLTLREHSGMEEIRRSYSMVSAPLLNEPPAIGVKRLDNGAFSRLLFRLKKGNILTSTGTGGLFTLPETVESQRFIFLAAGAGITPVFSLVKTLLKLSPSTSVTLIYSNHSPERTVFIRELLALENRYSNFTIEFLFSTTKDLRRARLNPELLLQLLGQYYLPGSVPTLFYICGPEAYMRMCLFTLKEAGILEENIRRENFVTRKKDPSYAMPPDKHRHQVIINRKGEKTTLQVQYPQTILAAAKQAGLVLPYSCETGICGNCAAQCVSGTVWMSNNEVLTDKDIRDKLVLTCTGYPVFGDVILKLRT